MIYAMAHGSAAERHMIREAIETGGTRNLTSIQLAIETNDRPVVIDFVVSRDAMVWPMVAAGTSNDEIMFARGVRPIFDDDDV